MAQPRFSAGGTFLVTVQCLQREGTLTFEGECNLCIIPMVLVTRELNFHSNAFDIILHDGDNVEEPDPASYQDNLLVLTKTWNVVINLQHEEIDDSHELEIDLQEGQLLFVNCASGAEITSIEAQVSPVTHHEVTIGLQPECTCKAFGFAKTHWNQTERRYLACEHIKWVFVTQLGQSCEAILTDMANLLKSEVSQLFAAAI